VIGLDALMWLQLRPRLSSRNMNFGITIKRQAFMDSLHEKGGKFHGSSAHHTHVPCEYLMGISQRPAGEVSKQRTIVCLGSDKSGRLPETMMRSADGRIESVKRRAGVRAGLH